MSNCPVPLVATEVFALVIEPEQAPAILVATGDQGPPGPPGPPGGGSGVTYMQDYQPASAIEQQTWYNPLTLQLQVYTAVGWQPVSPDGGNF